LTSILSL